MDITALYIVVVFANGSVLECRARQQGDKFVSIHEQIMLEDEAPPIEVTTGVSNPDAQPRGRYKSSQ